MRRFLAAFAAFLCLLPPYMLHSPALADEPHPANPPPLELIQRGEDGKALEQLQKQFNLFPYDTTARSNLAAAYAIIGKRQLERRQYDDAAASFDHARELEPDNGDFHLGRGIALYCGKRYDDALFELEQARLLGGDSAVVLLFLGKVSYDTGNLEKALEAWRNGVALDPGNAQLAALVEKTEKEMAVEARKGKESAARFTISYDVASETRLADEILDVLDSAYNQVGADLDHYPDARIPVILYTRQEFRSAAAGPDWSGGLYDGKIRLPVGGVRKLLPSLRGVLFHEYTHVVVRELTKGNCPTWLNEGLAMVEERKVCQPSDQPGAAGDVLPQSVLDGSFMSLGQKAVAQAYAQSFAMASYLVSTYGLHKVREILVNLGTGMKMDAAVTAAFRDIGVDYASLMAEVRGAVPHE